MKYKWLYNKQNNDIIIFFNGWGMDENVVKHIYSENRDVLMFYDYNTLDTDFDFEILNKYKNRFVIAWSMGVMVATLFELNQTSATAINGTLKPIDDNYGIPNRIYDLTLKSLNMNGIQKFINNMFSVSCGEFICGRVFEEQKNELLALKQYRANEDFKYNKIIISSNDIIIPTRNQEKFWNQKANFNGGHCIFFDVNTWSELL